MLVCGASGGVGQYATLPFAQAGAHAPTSERCLKVAPFLSCIKRGGLTRAASLVAGANAEPTVEVLDGLEATLDRLVAVSERRPRGKLVVRL